MMEWHTTKVWDKSDGPARFLIKKVSTNGSTLTKPIPETENEIIDDVGRLFDHLYEDEVVKVKGPWRDIEALYCTSTRKDNILW